MKTGSKNLLNIIIFPSSILSNMKTMKFIWQLVSLILQHFFKISWQDLNSTSKAKPLNLKHHLFVLLSVVKTLNFYQLNPKMHICFPFQNNTSSLMHDLTQAKLQLLGWLMAWSSDYCSANKYMNGWWKTMSALRSSLCWTKMEFSLGIIELGLSEMTITEGLTVVREIFFQKYQLWGD